jgi:hypothetical protein
MSLPHDDKALTLVSDDDLLSLLALIAKGNEVDLDGDALTAICVELLARRREDEVGRKQRPKPTRH